jgi:hypothetical protein
MATYKFYYLISGNNNVQQKEYNSSYNVLTVEPYFKKETPNVTQITRVDILSDPEGINTDEALGYVRPNN